MKIVLLIIIIPLFSCNNTKVLEKHTSPNAGYLLQVELDDSKCNDEHLGLRIFNKLGTEADYVRTLSNDHMKWVVTWYNDTTIILNSRDVGLYGWVVSKNGKLKEIDPSTFRDAEDKSARAFRLKYAMQSY